MNVGVVGSEDLMAYLYHFLDQFLSIPTTIKKTTSCVRSSHLLARRRQRLRGKAVETEEVCVCRKRSIGKGGRRRRSGTADRGEAVGAEGVCCGQLE